MNLAFDASSGSRQDQCKAIMLIIIVISSIRPAKFRKDLISIIYVPIEQQMS